MPNHPTYKTKQILVESIDKLGYPLWYAPSESFDQVVPWIILANDVIIDAVTKLRVSRSLHQLTIGALVNIFEKGLTLDEMEASQKNIISQIKQRYGV